MVSIRWCAEKRDGLTVVGPNHNLSEAYVKKAEEALESMRADIAKDWKISMSYYAMYFSVYAILMKIGVKCEIHSCTIEFARQFLKDYFDPEEIEFLGDSLRARIDSQYYVDKTVPDRQYMEMIRRTPEFLVKCKTVLARLDEKSANEIVSKFKKIVE